MNIDNILNLLEEKYSETDYTDCFTYDVKLGNSTRLEVYVDCDSGMTLEKCRNISRYLESEIEENNWLPERYTIEVSSPGIGAPLKFARQYINNLGRNVKVYMEDGSTVMGELINTTESVIEIKEEIPSKKKRKEYKEHSIDKALITKAVVIIK